MGMARTGHGEKRKSLSYPCTENGCKKAGGFPSGPIVNSAAVNPGPAEEAK
jgi:hypothetical protein